MSQILLVSDDAATSDEIGRALRSLGHAVRTVADLDAARDAVTARPAEIVVVDTDEACTEGRDAVRRIQELTAAGQARPRVVWTGVGVASGLGLVFVEVPDSVLPPPVTLAGAGTALARLDRSPGTGGRIDLQSIDGSCEHYPPFRVLWALALNRGTGRLELYLDEVEREIHVSDGRIVAARGFPDALADAGVEGDEDDDLETLIGRAIAGGRRPDLAMEAAARGLVRTITASVGRSGGMVFFDPQAEPPERSLPLPVSLPRMLVEALAAVRPVARVRAMLGPHRSDLLSMADPGYGPQDLPPVALRLWRAAQHAPLLGEELAADQDGAWLAADLLLQLGLARLQARDVPEAAPVAEPSAPAERPPAERTRADRRLRERLRERAPRAEAAAPRAEAAAPRAAPSRAAPPVEPPPRSVHDELLAERTRLAELDALGVLGITKASELVQRSIDERFRLLSARFHPDRYTREDEQTVGLARDCFALVNEAYQALRVPEHQAELKARLEAQEAGRVYVSESDRRNARLLFAKGDVAFRRRQWDEAAEALAGAHALNPEDWRTTFLWARARFELGTLTAADAAAALLALDAPAGRQRSDLKYQLGELLLAADRQQAAFKAFQEAVEEWEDNIDAKRRLRLRTMRTEGADAVRGRDAEEREKRAQARSEDPRWGGGAARQRDAEPPTDAAEPRTDKAGAKVARTLGDLFKRR